MTIYTLFDNHYAPTKVHTKNYSVDGTKYNILNYDTSVVSTDDHYRVGAYRSVVVEPETNAILAFAPPKSTSNEYFKNYKNIQNIYANETIEGTMINLFYDKRINSWEISTKGAVGGRYWFFRTQYEGISAWGAQYSFRQMFMDALGENCDEHINNATIVKELDKSYIYSFVVQHPMNHIVLNITCPTVYLVAGYCVKDNNITSYSASEMSLKTAITGPIAFPNEIDISGLSFDDVKHKANTYPLGIMLHDSSTGARTSIVNSSYTSLRDIRGNNPNLHYHYLSLFAAKRVGVFLESFPIYKNIFYGFYRQSYEFIKDLHNAYVSYYVKKMGQSVRIHPTIFTHIYKIHNTYYLPTCNSDEPTIVNRNVVANYFNSMEPKEKLYHLTYRTREYNNKNAAAVSERDSSDEIEKGGDLVISAVY